MSQTTQCGCHPQMTMLPVCGFGVAVDASALPQCQCNGDNQSAQLTENLDLYVSTTGSDTNDGLTPETAFATIMAAVNSTQQYARSRYLITINVASGTYTEDVAVNFGYHYPFIKITGDAANMPVVAGDIFADYSGLLTIENVHCKSPYRNFAAHRSANLIVHNCRATTTGTTHHSVFLAFVHGIISITGTLVVDCQSGTPRIFYAYKYGSIFSNKDAVMTFNGTVSSTVAYSAVHGLISCSIGSTIKGTVTGSRYSSSTNSIITAPAASPTFFPGTVAGTVATGGIYV